LPQMASNRHLGSLRSPESQRGYTHAIDEFIAWYCSEPRLSFNRIVVLRYRMHLQSRTGRNVATLTYRTIPHTFGSRAYSKYSIHIARKQPLRPDRWLLHLQIEMFVEECRTLG